VLAINSLDGAAPVVDDVDGAAIIDDIDGAAMENDVDGAPMDAEADGAPMGMDGAADEKPASTLIPADPSGKLSGPKRRMRAEDMFADSDEE